MWIFFLFQNINKTYQKKFFKFSDPQPQYILFFIIKMFHVLQAL